MESIKDTTDQWQTGKFMAFLDRNMCIDTFLLSKILYKTSILELKKGDIEKITSAIISWIYQDTLLKTKEEVLYRKIIEVGLRLFNIESKSKANLIISFLQSAVSQKITKSLLQHAIFYYYLKGIRVKVPFFPPYISHKIFSIVKEAVEEGLIIENLKT